MVMRNYFFLGLLVFACTLINAQNDPPKTEAAYEKEYAWRIQQEQLFNTYIPADLADAFVQLNKLIDKDSRLKYKTLSEEEAMHKPFFSFGRWIAHNWQFYEGSRFAHYLRQLGLSHPDDMTRFVLVTYHRQLNGRPLEAKGLVETLAAARRSEVQQSQTILHEEVRKRPKDGGR